MITSQTFFDQSYPVSERLNVRPISYQVPDQA